MHIWYWLSHTKYDFNGFISGFSTSYLRDGSKESYHIWSHQQKEENSLSLWTTFQDSQTKWGGIDVCVLQQIECFEY